MNRGPRICRAVQCIVPTMFLFYLNTKVITEDQILCQCQSFMNIHSVLVLIKRVICYCVFYPGRGHYAFMKKTHLRAGFQAAIETDFLYLSDSCLQFFYRFVGETYHKIKIVIKLRQEVRFFPSFILSRFRTAVSLYFKDESYTIIKPRLTAGHFYDTTNKTMQVVYIELKMGAVPMICTHVCVGAQHICNLWCMQ